MTSPRPKKQAGRAYAKDKRRRRLALALVILCGCSGRAPIPRPETAAYVPEELAGIYLGMERDSVAQWIPVHSTHLTDDGLETMSRFFKDSVQVGVACAYRDDRLATATIWYDYSLVPEQIDRDRPEFLSDLMERNGLGWQPCSFIMPGANFVPDVGLSWWHPGFRVVATFSKSTANLPDSVEAKPYFQFCMFDSVTSVVDLWTNIVIPADPAEMRYFREADSLRDVLFILRSSRGPAPATENGRARRPPTP